MYTKSKNTHERNDVKHEGIQSVWSICQSFVCYWLKMIISYRHTVSRGYFLFFSFEYLFHENLRRINTTMQFMHPNKCTKNGAGRKFDQKVHFLMKRANYVSRTPEDVLNDIWLCCINNVCLQFSQPQRSFSLSRIDFIRPGYNSIYHSSLLVYAIACGKVKWKT